MADKEHTNSEDVSEDLPAAQASRLGKFMITAFVGLVIFVECGIAYFWIPSAEQVEAIAKAQLSENLRKIEEPEESLKEIKDKIPEIEVDLGTYGITAHQPASGVTLRIDFHLMGTVSLDDKDVFQKLYKTNEHRLRDKIIFEIRNSQVTDLTDPGLGLIKRRILEKSNALFGKSLLRSIMVSDFSFVEQ